MMRAIGTGKQTDATLRWKPDNNRCHWLWQLAGSAEKFYLFPNHVIMPESRKRTGHHYQKPADIPTSQRVKGRIIWALLFGAFGLLIAFFMIDTWPALLIGALLGSIIGFYAGKAMEQEAKHK
jgi:hypothetical protein